MDVHLLGPQGHCEVQAVKQRKIDVCVHVLKVRESDKF